MEATRDVLVKGKDPNKILIVGTAYVLARNSVTAHGLQVGSGDQSCETKGCVTI